MNIRAFDARSFRSLYDSPDGDRVWKFMNQLDTRIQMETATRLSRPAVEPLADGLVQLMPDLRKSGAGGTSAAHRESDRWRQMIGAMARQVMEANGYQVRRNGVAIRKSNPVFVSGTRYKRCSA